MIVQVKLSIPNEKFVETSYLCQQLWELSKENYPGFIKINKTGLQGIIKRKAKQKPSGERPIGNERAAASTIRLWN